MTTQDKFMAFAVGLLEEWRGAVERYHGSSLAFMQEQTKTLVDDLLWELNRASTKPLTKKAALDLVERLSIEYRTTLVGMIAESSSQAASYSSSMFYNMLSVKGAASSVSTVPVQASQIREFLLSKPVGKWTLHEWIYHSLVKDVDSAFASAMGTKTTLSSKEFANQLRKVLGGSFQTKVETVLKLYSQAGTVQVMQAFYQKNQNLLKGYVYTTARDSRVCLWCYPLDGLVFLEGQNRPTLPRHPRCRCVYVPEVNWQMLGIGQDQIPASGKRPIPYLEWLDTQPAGFRKKVLGPVRYRLLNEGKMSKNDLMNNKFIPNKLNDLGYTTAGNKK